MPQNGVMTSAVALLLLLATATLHADEKVERAPTVLPTRVSDGAEVLASLRWVSRGAVRFPSRDLEGSHSGHGSGRRGPITERLQSTFFDQVYGRRDAHPEWLALVR